MSWALSLLGHCHIMIYVIRKKSKDTHDRRFSNRLQQERRENTAFLGNSYPHCRHLNCIWNILI